MKDNGLNAPIETQGLSDWIKKHTPTIYSLQEIHFKFKDTWRLKVNRWRKTCRANNNQKKARIAILISDSADFKARKMIRDKEEPYIMIKGSLLQEDVRTLNMYVPNNKASKSGRQKLITFQRETDESSNSVGDFNTPLSEMDRPSSQKISKNIFELNTIISNRI